MFSNDKTIITRYKFSSKNWNEDILLKHESSAQVSDVKIFGVTTNHKLNLYSTSMDMLTSWLTDHVSSYDKLLVKSCKLKMETSTTRALCDRCILWSLFYLP